MIYESVDKHPLRTLAISLGAGSALWVLGFFLLLFVLSFARERLDPSVVNFYPLMAAIGAVFGLERWWTYESGGVNPFHDR